MKVGIKLSGVIPTYAQGLGDLLDSAVELEGIGVDDVILGEHLLYSPTMIHPGSSPKGLQHGRADRRSDMGNPTVLLAGIAARTTRLACCSGITLAPLYPAALLAAQAATLDVVSGGRFVLGVGGGWSAMEYAAMAVPFEERFARLEEVVQACRVLWTESPASFEGRWTRFEGVVCEPAPVRPEGVPVWWGGKGVPVTARRIAALADGWIASEAASVADIDAAVAMIRRACDDAGRDPSLVGFRASIPPTLPPDVVGRPDEMCVHLAEAGRRLADVGITHVTVPLGVYGLDLAAIAPLVSALQSAG